jgi:ATP-dependent Lon protease
MYKNNRYELRSKKYNNLQQFQKNNSSDDDDELSSGSDEFDLYEYRKLLSDMFPSKFMTQRVEDTRKSVRRKHYDSPPNAPRKKPRNKTIFDTKNYSQNEIIDFQIESEDYGDSDEDYCDSDEENEEENEEEYFENNTVNKTNIEKLRESVEKATSMFGESSSIKKEFDESLNKIESELHKNKNEQDEKKQNTHIFNELLKDRNMMNDTKFFNEKLTLEEQNKIIKELKAVHEHCYIDKPYRLTLLDTDIPPEYKAVAYKKINSLKNLEPGGNEYYKIKQWVDTFMQVPFGKYKNLPVTLHNDGPDKCSTFMENAKQTLDDAVYGMNDVKLQIMQLVGQWITNPNAMGNAIAIKGPMGTGKTTLVKEGISKVLGRDFAFLALGGATDSCFLEGHSYTYEGSTWGKIVDILVQSKSMNPVIFLDELDKVSNTPKGDEIIGILTHLTDTTQNSKFHDKYFSEIDFDLSRALFIFSYNDESKVNPILLDRMYRVQTKGYESKEKIVIANKYLLPKIREQVMFNENEIIISDTTMKHIIERHTEKEYGVRNLKRCLEIIYTKMNLYRLMKPNTTLFEKEMTLTVRFPMTITHEIVDMLISTPSSVGNWQNMYI